MAFANFVLFKQEFLRCNTKNSQIHTFTHIQIKGHSFQLENTSVSHAQLVLIPFRFFNFIACQKWG